MRTYLKKNAVLLVAFIALSLTFASPILAAEGDVEINETNFPDDAFREFVTQYDTSGDGTLQVTELEAVTEIDLYSYNIVDLTGIKHFTKIADLKVDCGNLVSLDLSGCTSLADLNVDCKNLVSLDVSACTSLENLSYFGYVLETLDVTGCTNLKKLYCEGSDCFIEPLDLSSCTNLTDLTIMMFSSLTSLNVTGCTNLETLFCGFSSLESLNLSGMTKLKKLGISFNHVESLDLSACKDLIYLSIWRCNLSELDLSELDKLQKLDCSDNRLTSLDVSGCTDLWQLTAGEQWIDDVSAVLRGEHYEADLGALYGVDIDNIKEVTLDDGDPLPDGFSYDPVTGILKMDADPGYTAFKYVYDTNANLDKLDVPPPGFAEYDEEAEFDEEEEEGWSVVDSSPDLEVRFTINIVEESLEAPVVLETEDDNVEIGEDGVVIFQQREQSEDDTAEDVIEGGISLMIEGNVDDFRYVTLNGRQVARQHYDVKEGSIIVTLKDAFLSSLPPGEYVVKLFTKAFVSSQNILLVAPEPEPEPEPDPAPEPEPVPEADSEPTPTPTTPVTTAPEPTTAPTTTDPSQQVLDVEIPASLNEGNDIDASGDSVVFHQGTSTGAAFKVNGADVADFKRVEVNGQEIGSDNYTVEAGSIIVKLKQAFLNSLPEDVYKVAIVTSKGTGVKNLLIKAPMPTTDAKKPVTPTTGEVRFTQFWWFALLLFVAGSVLLLSSIYRRRRESR